MSSQDIPVNMLKTYISAEINSTILGALLWGMSSIYTIIYTGTLYLYLNRKSSGSRLIVGAISLSYAAYTAYSILVWYIVQFQFVNNSETRETLFLALRRPSAPWLTFATDVSIFVVAAVADGILIWRCYNVWGFSVRAIILPIFLIFIEVVVDLVVLILQLAAHFNPSESQRGLINQLISAQTFITFATTLTSTSLIAYRLYMASKQEICKTSKALVKRIIEILGHSAAAYSLAAIVQAILLVIPPTPGNVLALDSGMLYMTELFNFICGVAPTVLVARVAMINDSERNTSSHSSLPVSGLRFQVASTTSEGRQATATNDLVDARSIVALPVIESEKQEKRAAMIV